MTKARKYQIYDLLPSKSPYGPSEMFKFDPVKFSQLKKHPTITSSHDV